MENANQDKMTVCVRMVADPLRLNAETSQTATKAYERATLITIFRVSQRGESAMGGILR